MPLTDQELIELHEAKKLLENPGIGIKISNAIGMPIEKGFDLLPKKMAGTVQFATKAALQKAVGAAVMTLADKKEASSHNFLHKMAAATSGAAGGAFGLASLPVELPVSTVIIFRSILDIAREQGESIKDPATLVASLEVFALGGNTKDDEASEASYYAIRATLAKSVSEAVEYLARKQVVDNTAPALVRLIASIAARFGVVVSQKTAAAAVPIVGAAGGAAVNTVFMNHFQSMAKGHFIVRRLERLHGKDTIKHLYEKL